MLRPITPTELQDNPKLYDLLIKSINGYPLSLKPEDLVREIVSGKSILWTWGDGVLMTTQADEGMYKVLYVTNVAGEGYLENIDEIDKEVTRHAKAVGARYIIGDVPSKALVKIYERRGGKPLFRVMREV